MVFERGSVTQRELVGGEGRQTTGALNTTVDTQSLLTGHTEQQDTMGPVEKQRVHLKRPTVLQQ